MTLKEPITVAEAARELGVSLRRAYVLIPRLVTEKLGSQIFIERSSLEAVRNRVTGRPIKDKDESE